jgi:GPH family glycoside/pentoside/hexuronide:cation symporter
MALKGRVGKIVYGLGSIGDTGSYQLLSAFLLFFLIDIVHFDSWLAGIVFLLGYGVWNAINDPIVGTLSDRTRTRFGRRKPFMMIGAPLMLIFYFLIFSPPLGGAPLADPRSLWFFVYILLAIVAYEFTYSMTALCWFAVFPEVWESTKDRTEVVVWRQIFAVVGGAIAMVVFPVLLDVFEGRFGELGAWGVSGVIVGALWSASYLISMLGFEERKEFASEKPMSIREGLRLTLKNKSLYTYMVIDLMTWCMFGWLSAMMPFFITHSLGFGDTELSYILGLQMLGTFAFFLVWRKVYISRGPIFTLGLSSIAFCASLSLALVVHTLPGAMVFGFVAGASVAGVLIAREVMMGDVVDEDEVKTGIRREGSYFGWMVAVEKISLAVVGLCTPLLLSTIIGYVPDQPEPEFMDMGLRLGMFGFTVVFVVILLVDLLKFYPLKGEVVNELRKEIEALHAEKAQRVK